MAVPAGRRKRPLLSWLGSQGEAGREGLWVGLWLLPIQLSPAGPWSPHPRSASGAGPVPNHRPSHREGLAKGAQELPRPRPLTSLTILPFPFLCPAPSFMSLSFPFCFLSHFSGSPVLLSSWTLPHPCPHGPFKSCFKSFSFPPLLFSPLAPTAS